MTTPPFLQRPFIPRSSGVSMPPAGGRFVLLPPYVNGRPRVSLAVEELPSIDDFLDTTPPIEQFAPSETTPPASDWPSWGGEAGNDSLPTTIPGTDWQGYDWGSAAALGNAPPDAAADAWASTDWSEPTGSRETRQSAAEALAQALEQISRRIRAGELRVPGPDTVQDDAAIATTLAALLGIRR